MPFFGNFLVVQDEIKSAEMMVVFSGDGENNYHNLSFQKRIVDIKNNSGFTGRNSSLLQCNWI